MATKNKTGNSKIFWIIGGLVLIAGGIGAYFLLRKKPEEDKGSGETEVDKDTKKDIDSGSGSSTLTAPSELNTTEKIKSFQDWMDKQGKGWVQKDGEWVLLNKGAGYGNYGKSTNSAWKVYGKDYLKSLSDNSDKNNDSPSDLSKDIDTINSKATGNKSQKIYLQKANSEFIQNWAKSLRNNKKSFIWANQVYLTDTGNIILEYNPIGRTFYTSKAGKIAKTSPSKSSQEWYVNKGVNLGKATAIEYNGGLWIYLPKSGDIYKWYSIDSITKTKPSSSFEGTTDEVEFANFDNNLDLNI